jgi:hypothetical protein
MIELMKNIMKWQALRKMQRSKFINSMYIWILVVPVVAKALYKIQERLNFNIFGQSIEITISLPFSWKVFFYSALSFSIANSIVLLFCPRIIKDYLSLAGFQGDGKTEEHLLDYAKDIGETTRPGNTVKSFNRYFWWVYDKANLSRTFRRILTLLFYAIGMGLFLWVLFSNIYWVTKFVL